MVMEKKNKESEFNSFWEQHQKQLILNAPKELRDEYVESTQLNSPLDWLCFILPLGVGIMVLSSLRLESEILSWFIMVVVVIVLFVLMQMIKPMFSKKKSTSQVVERIKEHYYAVYLQQGGLEAFHAWLG